MTVRFTSTFKNTDKRDLIETHIHLSFPISKSGHCLMILWLYYSSNNLVSFYPLLFLSYILNSVLARLCQYGNQTFSANQSVITPNCTERCQCHQINGTECKPLCPIQEDPNCHPHSERIKEFVRSLNHTNCTCTEKRCVSGINVFHSFRV